MLSALVTKLHHRSNFIQSILKFTLIIQIQYILIIFYHKCQKFFLNHLLYDINRLLSIHNLRIIKSREVYFSISTPILYFQSMDFFHLNQVIKTLLLFLVGLFYHFHPHRKEEMYLSSLNNPKQVFFLSKLLELVF